MAIGNLATVGIFAGMNVNNQICDVCLYVVFPFCFVFGLKLPGYLP
jgi:hypothetical protein